MINYVFLFICVTAGVMFTIIMKLAERAGLSVLAVGLVNYAVASFICLIIVAATCGLHASRSTIILGVLTGISYSVAYLSLVRAIRMAGVAIPQIAVRAAVVLPTLFSIYFFDETLYLIQWSGLAILLVAFPLVGIRAVGYQPVPARKAIPVLAALVAAVGAQGSLFKLFAESGASQEKVLFLLLVFAVAGIAIATVLVAKRVKWGAGELRMGIALGTTNVFTGLSSLLLLERMSGALVFPLLSGGGVIMCIILTWAILRERLRSRSLIGALLAAAALFLLGLN